MSKLSFRARALDASKPLPIYMSEELPDLPEYSAINRAVPQMPSGMEKEEECEHHLQRAIVTGLIIPTPEVTKVEDVVTHDRLYPPTYRPPRQLIRMQPFAMEEDYPDYDIDSEDEKWITMQKLDISPRKFEEMMDRLEKNCAQNFAAQDRKELLLKDDDELSIAIYDYWLSKRLKTPQSLVPCVKTEVNNRVTSGSGGGGGGGGNAGNNNPYLAFRRRTEKMQTRKNRKNDEASYEKMVKLKRDLSTALSLLELVKRRETTKRQLLYATIQIYEKRYQANDLSGALLAEVSALKSARPAFQPLYHNHPQYTTPNHTTWTIKPPKEEVGISRKEKRQYKKRKHKSGVGSSGGIGSGGGASSGEDEPASPPSPSSQVAFPFYRNKNCSYHAPVSGGKLGGGAGWEEADERFRFSLTSVGPPSRRCIGLARRRIGRGGRVIIDRAGPSMDDFWASLDFTIHDNATPSNQSLRHFRPRSPSEVEGPSGEGSWLSLEVEGCGGEMTPVELDLAELFSPGEAVALRREVLGGCPPAPPPTPPSVHQAASATTKRPTSLLERWVLETSVARPPTTPDLGSSLEDHTYRTNGAPECSTASVSVVSGEVVGSSEFSVTDTESPRTSGVQGGVTTRIETTANGPTHNHYGSSWLVSSTTGSSGIVCKRSGPASVMPSSNSSATVLNSKLPGRVNTNRSEEAGEEGGGMRRRVALLHTHPMEVT